MGMTITKPIKLPLGILPYCKYANIKKNKIVQAKSIKNLIIAVFLVRFWGLFASIIEFVFIMILNFLFGSLFLLSSGYAHKP